MFKNSGSKLQVFAMILFWLGLIGSIIYGIVCIANGNKLNDSRYSNGEGDALITAGWIILIAGSLGSWLSALGLYALGTATENSEYLVDTVEKIKKDMEEVRDELTKGGAGSRKNEQKKVIPASSYAEDKDGPRVYESYSGVPIEDRQTARAIDIGEDQEQCENCRTIQRRGRIVCFQCGARFIRGDEQGS